MFLSYNKIIFIYGTPCIIKTSKYIIRVVHGLSQVMFFCLFEAQRNPENHVTPPKFDILKKACNTRPLDFESISVYAQQ